jgi:hypothetical protein
VSLRIIILCAACIPVVSCGGFSFVGFVSNPGGTASITGTVTAVSNGFVSDLKGITPTTTVAFKSSDITVTMIFCGDQQSLFPLNTNVRAEYTAGVLCSVLTKVVIISQSENSWKNIKSHLATLIVLNSTRSEQS